MIKAHITSILYGFTALICGLFALFDHSDSIDISVHDTYFVIAKSHLWMLLLLCFVLFTGLALTFELLRKPLSKTLTVVHYVLTIGCFLMVSYLVQVSTAPTRYYDYSVYQDFKKPTFDFRGTDSLVLVFYLLFGAQCVFILNVVRSIFKKIPKKRH